MCPKKLFFCLSWMLLPLSAAADVSELLGITNPAVGDSRPTMQLTVGSFAANDFHPLHKFTESGSVLPDPKAGRNIAVGFGRLEASQSWSTWTFGAFSRADVYGKTNSETVRLYYAVNSLDKLLEMPGTHHIDYSSTYFSASGLRLAYWTMSWNDSLRIGGSANLLKAGRLRIDTASGIASVTNNAASVQGTREVLYSDMKYTPPSQAGINDFSPLIQQIPDKGWGYSFDLGMQWAPRSDLQFNLAINDVFGRLTWKNVPKITENFNNATFPLLYNGNPLISGTNTYQDYTLRLKTKAAASCVWTGNNWSLGGGVATTRGLVLPEINASWGQAAYGMASISYEPHFGSIGLGFRYGPAFLNLRSDQIANDKVRALGFNAGIAHHF